MFEKMKQEADFLFQRKKYEQAKAIYEKIIKQGVVNAHVLANLALIEHVKGRYNNAEILFKKALHLAPDFIPIKQNLASNLRSLGKLKEALIYYEEIFEKAKHINSLELFCNMGNLYRDLGMNEKAIVFYEKSLAIDPNMPDVRFNRSLLLLEEGYWEEGWREYECRKLREDGLAPYELYIEKNFPVWHGENIKDKVLLVYDEQGLGDCIHFLRYLKYTKKMAGKVILAVKKPLLNICRGFADLVIENHPDNIKKYQFDFVTSIMSLPFVLKLWKKEFQKMEDINAKQPYLKANEDLIIKWSKKINRKKMSVGLVWQGNKYNKSDCKRSLFKEFFAPLKCLNEKVNFYSLQFPSYSENGVYDLDGLLVVDLMSEVTDFSETAAIIANLDLVIAVDTSVVHLAGALGKEVWVLLSLASDWRWGSNLKKATIYKNVYLYQQEQYDNWQKVIKTVVSDLQNKLLEEEKKSLLVAEKQKKVSQLVMLSEKAFFQGELDNAVSYLDEALKINNDSAFGSQIYFNKGLILQKKNHHNLAKECYLKAIEIDKNNYNAYCNLASLYKEEKNFPKAEVCFQKCIKLKPEFAVAHYNLGTFYHDAGKFEQAISCLEQAVALKNDYILAYNNMGLSYHRLMQCSKAMNAYQKAISILGKRENHEKTTVYFNRALLYLQIGDWQKGFKEYESRKQVDEYKGWYIWSEKRKEWQGENLQNKTILIYAEQGFGDVLQFLRYAQNVKAKGGYVVLAVYQELLTLCQVFKGANEVVLLDEKLKSRRFDFVIPLMSLPNFLGVNLKNVLFENKPYLTVNKNKQEWWAKKLGVKNKTRVAIAWSGNVYKQSSINKSYLLQSLRAIFSFDKMEFYSLQKEIKEEDKNWFLKLKGKIFDFMPLVKDFSDTAALLIQMDLVITVDTALAHLAGALGKKVWLLLPFSYEWRWYDAKTNIWYENFTFFRAKSFGFCHTAVLDVYKKLARLNGLDSKNDDVLEKEYLKHFEATEIVDFALQYKKIKDLKKAELYFQEAIDRNPLEFNTWYNYGNFYLENKFNLKAIDCYKRALKLGVKYFEVWVNLAYVHYMEGNTKKSIVCYKNAIKYFKEGRVGNYLTNDCYNFNINAKLADIYGSMAQPYLLAGNLKEGFKYYEYRMKSAELEAAFAWYGNIPLWRGENFAGKKLLVHSEQGFGDVFQFCRYLFQVKERGGEVIFAITPQVRRLFKNFQAVDRLVDYSCEGINCCQCDFVVPLMSLPYIFGTDLKSIPQNVPYLNAEKSLVNVWAEKVLKTDALKVGLVWAGNPKNQQGLVRTCGFKAMKDLVTIENTCFYSLQVGESGKELKQFKEGENVVDLTSEIKDFADTAALIANLDLIITIDTSVAHLAGGMGKEVWLVLPNMREWRWLLKGDKTNWYPQMHLFRQEKYGDWQSVFCNIAEKIRNYNKNRRLGVIAKC